MLDREIRALMPVIPRGERAFLFGLLFALLIASACEPPRTHLSTHEPVRRIVSLLPAATDVLLALNAAAYFNQTISGQPDTRLNVTDSGLRGHDDLTRFYFQNKYSAADSPIPMASWFEAQLILAEARPSEAAAANNRIRAKQNLPLLTGGADLATVVEERRRQLFAEGHRLNDMLRHNIPFPTGFNHKGQAWGAITCMPLPNVEKLNNPNLQ